MACHIQFIPVFLTFSCLAYAEREKEEMGEIWFMRLDIEIRGVLKVIIRSSFLRRCFRAVSLKLL